MVHTVESVGSPFCNGWEHWRPDPNWTIPQLPIDWFDLGCEERETQPTVGLGCEHRQQEKSI